MFLYFFNRPNITRYRRQKHDLIGNFKSFKKMRFHPAETQTRRRKKNFDISLFFFILFNPLYITRPGRQKYELIGSCKSFKKMGLHPIDMQTRRQKKSIFPYFSLFLLTDFILSNRAGKNIN